MLCTDDQRHQVQTKPPSFHLNLGMGCRAVSEGLTVPSYYYESSSYILQDPAESLLTLQTHSAINILNPIISLNPTHHEIQTIANLPDLNDIPMNELIDKIKYIRQLKISCTAWGLINSSCGKED